MTNDRPTHDQDTAWFEQHLDRQFRLRRTTADDLPLGQLPGRGEKTVVWRGASLGPMRLLVGRQPSATDTDRCCRTLILRYCPSESPAHVGQIPRAMMRMAAQASWLGQVEAAPAEPAAAELRSSDPGGVAVEHE